MEKIDRDIQDEHKLKGFDGRFGAGLPRVSDGSLMIFGLKPTFEEMLETLAAVGRQINAI